MPAARGPSIDQRLRNMDIRPQTDSRGRPIITQDHLNQIAQAEAAQQAAAAAQAQREAAAAEAQRQRELEFARRTEEQGRQATLASQQAAAQQQYATAMGHLSNMGARYTDWWRDGSFKASGDDVRAVSKSVLDAYNSIKGVNPQLAEQLMGEMTRVAANRGEFNEVMRGAGLQAPDAPKTFMGEVGHFLQENPISKGADDLLKGAFTAGGANPTNPDGSTRGWGDMLLNGNHGQGPETFRGSVPLLNLGGSPATPFEDTAAARLGSEAAQGYQPAKGDSMSTQTGLIPGTQGPPEALPAVDTNVDPNLWASNGNPTAAIPPSVASGGGLSGLMEQPVPPGHQGPPQLVPADGTLTTTDDQGMGPGPAPASNVVTPGIESLPPQASGVTPGTQGPGQTPTPPAPPQTVAERLLDAEKQTIMNPPTPPGASAPLTPPAPAGPTGPSPEDMARMLGLPLSQIQNVFDMSKGIYDKGTGFYDSMQGRANSLFELLDPMKQQAQAGITDYYANLTNPFGNQTDHLGAMQGRTNASYTAPTNPFGNQTSNLSGMQDYLSGSFNAADQFAGKASQLQGQTFTTDDRFGGLNSAAQGLTSTATDRFGGMTDRTQGLNLNAANPFAGMTNQAAGLNVNAADRFGGVDDPWAGRADELRALYAQNQQQFSSPGSFDVANPYTDRANPWAEGNAGLSALMAGNRANIQRQFDLAQQQTQRNLARRGLGGSGVEAQAILSNSLERAKALGGQANADIIANYQRQAEWDTQNLGSQVGVDAANMDRRLKGLNEQFSQASGLQSLLNQALQGQGQFGLERAQGQAGIDAQNLSRQLQQAQLGNQFAIDRAQGQAGVDASNLNRQLDAAKAGNQFQLDQAQGQAANDALSYQQQLARAQQLDQFGLAQAQGQSSRDASDASRRLAQLQGLDDFTLRQAQGQQGVADSNQDRALEAARARQQNELQKMLGLDDFGIRQRTQQGDFDMDLARLAQQNSSQNQDRALELARLRQTSDLARTQASAGYDLDLADRRVQLADKNFQNLQSSVGMANDLAQTGLGGLGQANNAIGNYQGGINSLVDLINGSQRAQQAADDRESGNQQAIWGGLAYLLGNYGPEMGKWALDQWNGRNSSGTQQPAQAAPQPTPQPAPRLSTQSLTMPSSQPSTPTKTPGSPAGGTSGMTMGINRPQPGQSSTQIPAAKGVAGLMQTQKKPGITPTINTIRRV